MERRVLYAVILSMAVLYAYQAFLAPPEPPKTSQQAAATAPTPPAGSGTAEGVTATPAARAVLGDASERETVVETPDGQAVLTNRGGRVLHWRLKHYLDDQGKPVDLVPSVLPQNPPNPVAPAFGRPQ